MTPFDPVRSIDDAVSSVNIKSDRDSNLIQTTSSLRKAAAVAAVLCLSVFFFCMPPTPVAHAQESNPNTGTSLPGINSNQLVSIDFNNVDIGVFIKFISDLTKKNFVVNERVRGKVTIISPGKITVAEAYKVFESVLEVHGFAAVPAGEIIKIIPSPEARTMNIKTRLERESGAPNDTVITQIIPLRYADPNEIKRLFTPLVSKSSVILAYPPTNTLIVTDVQSNINRLLRILNAIDITGVGQQIAILPVEYADASKLVTLLNSVFKSGKGPQRGPQKEIVFVADERTNVIVVLASEGDTESIRQLVKSLDKETPKGQAKIHVYYLENASAEELAKVLQDIPQQTGAAATEGGGRPTAPVLSDKVRITADKATNSLIIMADLEDYLVLEDIIRKIDIPRSMVYIEALIMEVNVEKNFRLGTEWLAGAEAAYKGKEGVYGGGFAGGAIGGDPGYSATGIPTEAGVVAPLPPGFSVGLFGESITIGGIQFPSISAVVQAYKKDSDVRILSTPQILTTDNQEAKIYVGSNVPFQTTATATQTGNEVYNSFEYRDVGKTLKITPHISKDRMVRLELSLEVTSLDSSVDFRPTTLKRTVETTAIVKDRHNIVLGGLIDDTIDVTDYKVPCLGDIPGFGLLFRSMARANNKTNLYVFLTPRVIQSPGEAKTVYQQKRNEIESVREGNIKLYKKDASVIEETLTPGIEEHQYREEVLPDAPSDDQSRVIDPETTPGMETAAASTNDQRSETSPADDASAEPANETAVLSSTTQAENGQSEPLQESAPAPGSPDTGQTKASPSVNTAPSTAVPAAQARPTSSPSAPDAATNGYTVQVVSVKTPQRADKILKELTSQGYAAYTVRMEVSGTTWFRLRVGYFENASAAQEVIARLRTSQYNPILIKL